MQSLSRAALFSFVLFKMCNCALLDGTKIRGVKTPDRVSLRPRVRSPVTKLNKVKTYDPNIRKLQIRILSKIGHAWARTWKIVKMLHNL